MDDDQNPLQGLLSQAEQHMGQDAYQASVEAAEAHTASVRAISGFIQAKTTALNAALTVGTLSSLPVMVWLWRWALR